MGSELVIRRWCDYCTAEQGDVEGEGRTFYAELRLTVGAVDRVLDLCGGCFDQHLQPALDQLGDLGEAAGKANKVARKEQPAVDSSPAPAAASDRVPCPLCSATSASQNGLKQHVRIRHGLTWSQYREQHPDQDRLVA